MRRRQLKIGAFVDVCKLRVINYSFISFIMGEKEGMTVWTKKRMAIKRWHEMPFIHQMANIGSEVSGAIYCKSEKDILMMTNYCNLAINFLQRSISDPKNADRIAELERCMEVLEDYFFGENKYNTTDEVLTGYYDVYIELYVEERYK